VPGRIDIVPAVGLETTAFVAPLIQGSSSEGGFVMGGGLLYWVIVGLIAGWLAGVVMKGGGYGVLADIVLGILGAIVGGWIFSMLGIGAGGGLIGGIVVAFIGAVVLVWITRLLKKA
jgi:uncharacterized membrane protein YeaQ/YmgE (transglycosylase-associated protein family)